ncbi:LysR family transcriptional regulator [Defluviimonas sp. SAOS-178_SWC]|uniref:LysR family transcriptional regulator n=1 Tax=Defluviimonas sp. SAOS-178_SWC TaxID=3121287 RepID=UPI0032219595
MKINAENLNINLRHIRALHGIVQQGTFSAAAASLGIVPSALSEVIRQLEAQIGAPLFDRSTRPPSVTPLGRDFLRDTEPLLEGMDRAIKRLRQSAGLEQGALSIGASPSAISELVAPVLAEFLNDNPGISCVIHDDIAEELAGMVSDGRLDLAIAGRAHQSPDLRQREVMRDLFGLACRADHPLAARDVVHLAEIPAERLIGLDAKTGTHQLLKQSGLLTGALLHPKLRAHSTIAQLCMIRAGMGVALLPRNAVLLFRDPAITFQEIADLRLWRMLYLLQPARRAQSHAAQSFVARLERTLPALRNSGG